MILKPWIANFDFTKEFLQDIPMWVVLPNLPMTCWGGKSLSRIASAIGKPLYADECTSKQKKLSYARMLIEINVTTPLPTSVLVWEPDGRQFEQSIEYDWKPEFCEVCLKIGHYYKQKEVENQTFMQLRRRRRRPRENAQPTHTDVGPPKMIQEWRTKAIVDKTDKAAKLMVTTKATTGEHYQQEVGQRQMALLIREDQMSSKGPAKESIREEEQEHKIPELSCPREFPALVQRNIGTSEKTGGLRSNNNMPIAEIGLLETRVKEPNVKRVIKNILPGWALQCNYQKAVNGGIWLTWDPNVYSVDVEKVEAQIIHCLVKGRLDEFESYLTLVYGFNTVDQRKELWTSLADISAHTNKSWLIDGDFNAMLYTQDMMYGNSVTLNEIVDFSDCIDNLLLNELPWKGDYYTWSNNQQGAERIYKGIAERIENVRADLVQVQEEMRLQYSDNLLLQEKTILQNLEKWSLIEESILKQKASMKWIKLRDANTKYFSAVMKERSQRKKILEIYTNDGMKLATPTSIKEEIVKFYKSLMGTVVASFPSINKETMKNGPKLTHEQHLSLCVEVTEEEIYAALCAIHEDKASRVNGYNSCFFKGAWPMIKSDVVRAIEDFFTIGKLYKAINCTTITLVRKLNNPRAAKDFKPISCCLVLYKIISKVLANRLQKVITNIISEAHAGFIHGRKIADNIILAHELVKAYTRKNTSPRCMIKIDLTKAYDSVEWIFLEQVMVELEFPRRFQHWVITCVKTVSYSIMVNEEPSVPFSAAKGLR
uniref:Reverse transcriptase domain-containing protein n=1 Tax=Nicotiana tabacum TaxID=4097 RepID=A0A1S3ZCG0_TOBAC|nr:PREDICTED: uncharacterized protein LOC107785271 [Nicotiana tabacum]